MTKGEVLRLSWAAVFAGLVGYIVGGQHLFGPKPTVYLSSMGQFEPVHGIMHLECHNGNANESKKLDARALGIAFDRDKQVRILVELNDVPPNRYSPTTYWLKDAGLCQVYVQ